MSDRVVSTTDSIATTPPPKKQTPPEYPQNTPRTEASEPNEGREYISFTAFAKQTGYDIPPGVSKNPKKADAQPILDLAIKQELTGWCFNGKNKKFYRVAEVAKE